MGAPLNTIKVGKVRLSVWEGKYEGQPTLSFTLDKPYKKDGSWQSGKSFSRADLGNVILACIRACDTLYSQNQSSQTSQTNTTESDNVSF